MPAGDSQRQWFPEMIEMLRQQFHVELTWEELALLSSRLNTTLQQIRMDRKIVPPMFTCPECGARERSGFGRISVNATILAAGRFGVAPALEVKALSRRWIKYRKDHALDHYGRKAGPTIVCRKIGGF